MYVYIQRLRLRRRCLAEKDFVKHYCEMKSWFLNGGYPPKPVENQMNKVKFSIQRLTLRKTAKKRVLLSQHVTSCSNCHVRLFTTIYIFYR